MFSGLLAIHADKVGGKYRQPYWEILPGYEIRQLWPRIRNLGLTRGNPAWGKPFLSGQIPTDAPICRGILAVGLGALWGRN